MTVARNVQTLHDKSRNLATIRAKPIQLALPEKRGEGTEFFAPEEQNVYSHVQNQGLSLRQERHVNGRC